MAASMDIEKQFLRLIMFSHKISLPVVRTFFKSSVLGRPDYNNNICTFLEHHKHEIFHLVGDYKCCQCTNFPFLQTLQLTFRLGNDQFKKLYEVGPSLPGHFLKGAGGRVIKKCLCCVTVKKESSTKTYDISLLITILQNCGQLSDNNILWLDTIRKCRNRLCHLNDISDLSENEIHTLWGNLESSVLRLAAEVPSQPDYKETIELLIDSFKCADYSRETITPILDEMKLEINNNINGFKQNQLVALEEIRCLTTNVEQLSQNCKKDNEDMFKHVSKSERTIVHTQQDAFRQLSAQVAEVRIDQVDQQKTFSESSKTVTETMEHVANKIDFLVDIINKTQGTEKDETSRKSESYEEDKTNRKQKCSEDSIKANDIQRCKLRWRIETPGYLEHKKDDIVKVMKKSIEIVSIGTSYEIEDVYDGSITIDTLLPLSILQDKEAFHRSIKQFLDKMVSICGIDTTIPLVVKVQITLNDIEQGSVKYSINEMNHTTMIHQAVQAVPTMIDRSTSTIENETNKSNDNTDCSKTAGDVLMLYSMKIIDDIVLPPPKMPFGGTNYEEIKRPTQTNVETSNILLIACFKDVQWVESVLPICGSLRSICQIQNTNISKKLLNRNRYTGIIYIASQSSHGSNNLKPLLECLNYSKYFPKKIVTVKRDNILLPALLTESKQISISDEEEEWVSGLMDAISMTGSMLYSVKLFAKNLGSRLGETYSDRNYGLFLLIGSFKHVSFIGSVLSKYETQKTYVSDFEIRVQQTSTQFNNDTLKGIFCLLSNDFPLAIVYNPVITHLKLTTIKVVTLLLDQMKLPKILKDTQPIDASGNNEDWVPEFIDAVQNMLSIVNIIRFNAEYCENMDVNNEDVLLMGNTIDVEWFYSSLYKSEKAVNLEIELNQTSFKTLNRKTIRSIICVISKSSKEADLIQYRNIKKLDCWPYNVITVVRDKITVPNLFQGTKQIDCTGFQDEWLANVMDVINKTMSMVYICMYSRAKYRSNHYFTIYNDIEGEEDGLLLLIGNTQGVLSLYSTLEKLESCIDSRMKLMHIQSRNIRTTSIKSCISIISKSSKEEDFFIMDLEALEKEVVTVVRDKVAVPYFFKDTKQIVEDCKNEKWILDVIDVIHRQMSMGYILRYRKDGTRNVSINSNSDETYRWILLMGNFKEIRLFYFAILKSKKMSNIELLHVSTRQLHTITIQNAVYIIAKSSNTDFLQIPYCEDLKCEPQNIITVALDNIRVPKLLKKTKIINVTGNIHRGMADIVDIIKRTGLKETGDDLRVMRYTELKFLRTHHKETDTYKDYADDRSMRSEDSGIA